MLFARYFTNLATKSTVKFSTNWLS